MISTPSIIDARPHAEAVKAALNAALGVKARAFDFDEVPGTKANPVEAERSKPLPNIYVAVSLQRRPSSNLRSTGSTGRTGWYITAMCAGRTVDESRWAMARVAAGLNESRLTLGGQMTSPVHFESDQAPEWDDIRYAGSSLWTYAH